jgi:hypothetical protein
MIPTRAVWSAGTVLGWHGDFGIELGGGGDQQTVFTIAGYDDFTVLAALQYRFQAVQSQAPFLLLSAVTVKTRRFKKWMDIFGVRNTGLVGDGWEFAQVEFADIPFIIGLYGPTRQTSG